MILTILSYSLLLLSIGVFFYACIELRNADTLPIECLKHDVKSASLIVVVAIMYFINQARWILFDYRNGIAIFDELAWNAQEALVMIVLIRFCLRMRHCPLRLRKRLGQILVDAGKITEKDIQDALKTQKNGDK